MKLDPIALNSLFAETSYIQQLFETFVASLSPITRIDNPNWINCILDTNVSFHNKARQIPRSHKMLFTHFMLSKGRHIYSRYNTRMKCHSIILTKEIIGKQIGTSFCTYIKWIVYPYEPTNRDERWVSQKLKINGEHYCDISITIIENE